MSRPLREVLEELCPGVYGRNKPAWAKDEPNVCQSCGLTWIKCRCDGFVPYQPAPPPPESPEQAHGNGGAE